MKRCLFLIILLFNMHFMFIFNVYAQNNANIEVIINDYENTNVEIEFYLFNIDDLYQIDIRINLDNVYIPKNDIIFDVTNNCIFEENPVINDYIDGIYRLIYIKNNNILEGYTITTNNYLCKLQINKELDNKNIINFLDDEYFQIKLYNTKGQVIDCKVNFSEKIDYSVNKNIELNVFEEIPDFRKLININNRTADLYQISVDHNVENNIIGEYFVNITIFDKLNKQITKDKINVTVKDNELPKIKVLNDNFKIQDVKLSSFNIKNYFTVSDNYDTNVKIVYKYYSNTELMEDEFYEYLKNNKYASFKLYAVDSSGNKSVELKYNVEIIDTISPMLVINDVLEIDCKNLIDFNINNYLKITDNYDQYPRYTVSYYDKEEYIIDLKEYLKLNKDFQIEIITFDNANNYSEKKTVLVKVIDTVKPTIELKDIIIGDTYINSLDINSYVVVSDNMSKELNIQVVLYLDNEVLKTINSNYNNELIDVLVDNSFLEYAIFVEDECGNTNSSDRRKIELIDETKPVISIKDVYEIKNIKELEINIKDNRSINLDIKYYLNEEEISLDTLENLSDGLYNLKIVVKDENNNETILNKEFKITKDYTISEIPLLTKIIDSNYLVVIIIIFIISLIILIVRIKNNKDIIKR